MFKVNIFTRKYIYAGSSYKQKKFSNLYTAIIMKDIGGVLFNFYMQHFINFFIFWAVFCVDTLKDMCKRPLNFSAKFSSAIY